MEKLKKPFVSESYYSVGTNMPCASVFYPIMNGAEMAGIMAGDIKLSALHDMVAETANADFYSFILDGKGVVVAHPDSIYQEELYNYAKLTKTVTLKDAAGKPMQNARGNLTEEQNITVPQAYKAAIADMMRGNTNSAKFREEGKYIYLSYRPAAMNGASDPWYVLSVRDEAAAMRARNTVILVILCSSGVVILAAFVLVFFIARNVSSPVKKLEALSMTDELTELNNRRSFLEYMNTIWALCRRLRTPVNVLMIDVDYFKKYNDSMGHLEGDKALIAVAQCMKNHIKREADFVARFGGEEFVCLIPFLKKEEALNIAKDLVQKIEGMEIPHPMSGCSKYVTVSIGLASATPVDHNSQTQLLDKADRALYTAKQSGRNRVVTE
jgi:diguanylate cyclase (GGDEF)-like protein